MFSVLGELYLSEDLTFPLRQQQLEMIAKALEKALLCYVGSRMPMPDLSKAITTGVACETSDK